MGISNGSSLGPYKVLSPLSRGGEGSDVYRARDTRSGREVAVQVVSRGHSADPSWVRRFEEEARAASALSHPNIASVHDAGLHDGSPYVVTELVGGESLREKLGRGALPVRRAVKYALQVLRGLAAAHGKGTVHGGLRPESLFITHDDRVKILGFGLAELDRADPAACYLAPEQARGRAAAARSDVFAVGAVLYEMLTGRRAFERASPAETRNAILVEEPAPLTAAVQRVPPGVAAVVRGCLEKEPGRRFQSAEDAGAALEVAVTASGLGEVTPGLDPGRMRRRAIVALASAVLLVGTHFGIHAWGAKSAKTSVPSFTLVTFRRGEVGQARFSPDGQTVVYTARWEGKRGDVFSQRLGTADARSFGLTGTAVMATFGGEMAVVLRGGTLARVPLEGGTPREMLEDVASADWSRDGKRFLVVRWVGNRSRLECPIGTVLYQTSGLEEIVSPRLSPQGDRIAFIDQPTGLFPDEAGDVVVMDLSGKKQVLSGGWEDSGGLAWSSDGREVWFTATKFGTTRALHAVTLAGKERLVARLAGSLVLEDIAPDGRGLLTHGRGGMEMRGRMAGDGAERDLAWFDGTSAAVLSPDGTRMVFQEYGDAGGSRGSTYLRRMDGSPPVRLGEGIPFDVSPDWKWVLCGVGLSTETALNLVPMGAGETKALPRGSIRSYEWARWHPDGKRIVFSGNEAGRGIRLFVQKLPDGLPQAISPEGTAWSGMPVSPDGRYIGARAPGPSTPFVLYPIDAGEPRPIQNVRADEVPIGWSADGRSLFVVVRSKSPEPKLPPREQVLRLDLQTGHRQPVVELSPPDRAGVQNVPVGIAGVAWITPNGRYYAYTYGRSLSNLYLAEGLK